MKIQFTAIMEVDDVLFGFPEESEWFYNEIMTPNTNLNEELILHSNFIGDTVGIITEIKEIIEL